MKDEKIPDVIEQIKELKKKQKNGEPTDEQTQEGIKALAAVSTILESINSGKMVDIAFYKLLSKDFSKRMNMAKKKKVK